MVAKIELRSYSAYGPTKILILVVQWLRLNHEVRVLNSRSYLVVTSRRPGFCT